MEEGRRRLGFQTVKEGYSACIYIDGQLQLLGDFLVFIWLGLTLAFIFHRYRDVPVDLARSVEMPGGIGLRDLV